MTEHLRPSPDNCPIGTPASQPQQAVEITDLWNPILSRRHLFQSAFALGTGAVLLESCGNGPTKLPAPTPIRPGLEPTSSPTEQPTSTEAVTNPQLITIENGQFIREGRQVRFAGANIYPIAVSPSDSAICGPVMQDDQITQWIDTLSSMGGNIIREWNFPALMTDAAGKRDFSRMDFILQYASAKGILAYPTLENYWKDCTNGAQKDDAWFAGGFRKDYLPFVKDFTAKYKGDPRIFAFLLINEAEGDPLLLQQFSAEVITAIEKIDPARLATLGVIGTGQRGAGNMQEFADLIVKGKSRFITLNYYSDRETGQTKDLPGDPWNGMDTRIQVAQTLNLPFMFSEWGNLQTSAQLAQQEANSDREYIKKLLTHPNFSGMLWWNFLTPGFQHQDGYGFDQSSPEASVMRDFAPQIINVSM